MKSNQAGTVLRHYVASMNGVLVIHTTYYSLVSLIFRCPSLPVIELDSKLKDHISMAPYTEVLPKKVLTSINPPCMELVVWRPRVDVILQLNREEESGYAKSNLETSSGDDIMDVE
eukprot:m.203891 g.203891  ORF g.203891 m.203891 type:complete len:116 (+) comp39633_c0_seq10:1660-2007(+)